MGSWIRRQGPAFAVACLALMAALGGSVYAAARIDGHRVRRGSLPGNRIKRASLPGNRLKRASLPGDRLRPGTLPGNRIAPGSLTGVQVNAATLGKVPEAGHADSAATARAANTAIAAASAREASRLNGHVAACAAAQRLFAGVCWEVQLSAPASAPQASAACASRGGVLPEALALLAFGREMSVDLAVEGEWSSDVTNVSGPGAYAVVTVSRSGLLDFAAHNVPHPYRCVIPFVS